MMAVGTEEDPPGTRDGAGGALELPPALVVAPGGRGALAAGAGPGRPVGVGEARERFGREPLLLAHAALTARRLGLPPPPRSEQLLDVLELHAFVRPAVFCAPSAVGLLRSLGRIEVRGLAEQAEGLRSVAEELLTRLRGVPKEALADLAAAHRTLERAGWGWAPFVGGALRAAGAPTAFRAGGLDVFAALPEWEDAAPLGETLSRPVPPEAARERLAGLLTRSGLDEARPSQAEYAAEAAFAFGAREREGQPLMMLADAGTGVGKTLGYLAPATLFAEVNGPSVWISTYTRALQRQIEREAASAYPDPETRARKAVVRKGRENYLCLLNYQEAARAAALGGGDAVAAVLTGRWILATRDGDMTGGDYPAWLPSLFALGGGAGTHPSNLIDRRGECVHAACPHYRICFVEKAIRASRRADLVIANHALVLTQAAFDGARRARGRDGDVETASLRRIVFDEGHHLFEAADAAFSACLSGQEAAELRRWVRGAESRRRGRGLEQRVGDLVAEDEEASAALGEALRAAALLPGEGWSARLSRGEEGVPSGPLEAFFKAVADQVSARGDQKLESSKECEVRPATEAVVSAARAAREAISALERPLVRLAAALEDLLDRETESLQAGERARIEGALRGLDRRARIQLASWRGMLEGVERGSEDPLFVDWFEAQFQAGRLYDVAFRRHWVDPTEPLEASVLRPAHGVLVTSATLADMAHDAPFSLAEMRTGAARLSEQPKTLRFASPFDYASNARAIVVTDVPRDDSRRTAAAMRALFLAAGGGGVGLFTAIRRLKEAYQHMAEPLAAAGVPLYAQHVDPLEISALIDIFRAEEDACLLGTDAVRDGVDVPGRALRLLVFDRVPWPRPDLLHRARRGRFGGRGYDDASARARIAQAFGRLIRRADDRGVFIMLDAQAPSRLFSGLPEGVTLHRMGLRDALDTVSAFLGPATGADQGAGSA